MTTFPYSRSPRYNQLKKKALEIFARQGDWLTPPEWAVLAGFYPIRAAYSYLLRLHRFGLLERRSENVLYYRISQRGDRRRVWLNRLEGFQNRGGEAPRPG
jgi:hypothetical protein